MNNSNYQKIMKVERKVYDLCSQGQEFEAIKILKTLTFDEARTLMDEAAIDNDCSFVMTYLMKNSKDGPSLTNIAQCEAVKCASVLLCSDYDFDISSFVDNAMTLKMVKFCVDRLGEDPNNFLQITENECDQEMVDFLMERCQ